MNKNGLDSYKIRNIVCIILSVLLVVGLFCLWYQDHLKEQEQTAALEQIAEEILAYEEELREAQEELADMQAAVTYTSDTAKIMIGFVISESSDIDVITALEDEYGFEPVLVLDCTEDVDTLVKLVDSLQNSEWEIMLGARTFSAEANETALAVREYIEEAELADTGVFFLRVDDFSAANVETLVEDGFIGYTKYNDSPTDGSTDEGIVYFDYTYIQTSENYPTSRLADAYANMTSMLAVFDIDALYSDTITEDYIEEVLTIVLSYTEKDDCTFSTVADVVVELSQINEIEAERQAEYEEESSELQERISELKEIISELYNQNSAE